MAQRNSSLNAYRSKSTVSSWFSSFGDAPGGFSEELREFQISAEVFGRIIRVLQLAFLRCQLAVLQQYRGQSGREETAWEG